MTTTLCAALFLAVLLVLPALGAAKEDAVPAAGERLTEAQVARFARVALAGITREYPNKPGQVLVGPDSLQSPRALHPAFYGCFDWHSAVHGHWMLVRLLRLYPEWKDGRAEVMAAVGANLTAEHLRTEAAYFDQPFASAFERTYGWAWLLRLAQELRSWEAEPGRAWAQNLRPLEARLVALAKAYLPKLRMPIRSGQHTDSAFALALFLDYARATGDDALAALCVERARTWYGRDVDYPIAYEPSGHDFFSAGLNAADLMRRVLEPAAYRTWLAAYLPGLATGNLSSWAEPATVEDVTDGHLVHLAGLNLTRAWTLRGIASVVPEKDPARARLDALVRSHTVGGLAYVFSGDYAGEHWLASFAIYLLTDAGLTR
ncbi:MAG: DUF2891 domain-containing protein [Planctomycetota bacterium]|nr:DUF2891 domain-containing protein [Planctomycetota bacterium]